ncbi:unnamed protein product [Cyclocybe aegerita]|uniref:Uncharacterized protein n=1 Tax=Cyclocybe aegerita TaxID=1973307 RepID=A0A8S0WTY9_CYCAE|nr:unnamed protein product [Cyclocybe aegerita]
MSGRGSPASFRTLGRLLQTPSDNTFKMKESAYQLHDTHPIGFNEGPPSSAHFARVHNPLAMTLLSLSNGLLSYKTIGDLKLMTGPDAIEGGAWGYRLKPNIQSSWVRLESFLFSVYEALMANHPDRDAFPLIPNPSRPSRFQYQSTHPTADVALQEATEISRCVQKPRRPLLLCPCSVVDGWDEGPTLVGYAGARARHGPARENTQRRTGVLIWLAWGWQYNRRPTSDPMAREYLPTRHQISLVCPPPIAPDFEERLDAAIKREIGFSHLSVIDYLRDRHGFMLCIVGSWHDAWHDEEDQETLAPEDVVVAARRMGFGALHDLDELEAKSLVIAQYLLRLGIPFRAVCPQALVPASDEPASDEDPWLPPRRDLLMQRRPRSPPTREDYEDYKDHRKSLFRSKLGPEMRRRGGIVGRMTSDVVPEFHALRGPRVCDDLVGVGFDGTTYCGDHVPQATLDAVCGLYDVGNEYLVSWWPTQPEWRREALDADHWTQGRRPSARTAGQPNMCLRVAAG